MDKLKNIFSPGHSKDDELMYGSGDPSQASGDTAGTETKGKVAGQGSHFGSNDPMSTTASSDMPTAGTGTSTGAGTGAGDYDEGSYTQTGQSKGYTGGNQGGLGTSSRTGAGTGEYDQGSYSQTGHSKGYTGGNQGGLGTTTGGTGAQTAAPGIFAPSKLQPTQHQARDGASTAGTTSRVPGLDPVESKLTTTAGTGGEYAASDRAAGHSSNAGNTSMAAAGAGTAWSSHQQSPPGGFPQDESSNPYRSSNLDPRVDSQPRTETSGQGMGSTTGGTTDPSTRSTGYGDTSTSRGYGDTTSQPNTSTGYGDTSTARGYDDSTSQPNTSSGYGATSASQPTSSSGYGATSTSQPTTSSGYGDSSTSQPTTSSTSDTTQGSEKKSKVAGMLGALGLGGAAAKEKHDRDRDTPSTTTGASSYDSPTQSGQPPVHHRKESIPTTAYPSGSLDSPAATAPPSGTSGAGNTTAFADERSGGSGTATIGNTQTYGSYPLATGSSTSRTTGPGSSDVGTDQQQERSHLGRDAALGAGAGAAGASAYGHRDQSGTYTGTQGGTQAAAPITSTGDTSHATFHDLATTQGSQTGTLPDRTSGGKATGGGYERETTGGYGGETAGGYGAGTTGGYGRDTTGPTSTMPQETSHRDRDAAAMGGLGAGAATAGGYEYSKHDHEKDNRKEMEKEQKAQDKAIAKEEKYREKEERKHEKALEKEESRHEKDHERALAEQTKYEQEQRRHKKEEAAAGAGAAGVGGAGAYEYEKDRRANEPHHEEKEKKPSLIKRIFGSKGNKGDVDDMEEEQTHHGEETAGGVGTAGATGVGGYEAEEHHQRNRLHKDPPASAMTESATAPSGRYADPPTKGYASQVTGGTGTTALAQGEGGPHGSHSTAFGNILDSRDTTGTGSFPGEPTESGRATSGVAYGDEPTSGYASQVTGGTGTTALAEGRSSQPIEHSGAGGTDSGTMPGVSQHSGGGFGSVENTSEERNQYSRGV